MRVYKPLSGTDPIPASESKGATLYFGLVSGMVFAIWLLSSLQG